MTFSDQIQYCAILAGTVTIGLALLHREFKEEINTLKRIVYAFVCYGIPWVLMTFVLLQLFSSR